MLPAHEQSGAQSKMSPVFFTRKVEKLNVLPIPFVLDMFSPFVFSDGSQTQPARTAAKSSVPPVPVPIPSNVPQAQPAQVAARLNVTKRDPIPPITAIRPDSSTQSIGFSELLQNGRVIDGFLEEINYYKNPKQHHGDIATPTHQRLQNEAICRALGQRGPFRGKDGYIDPLPLYRLLVTHPKALGEVLARLGL
jgi:hypothetical protein